MRSRRLRLLISLALASACAKSPPRDDHLADDVRFGERSIALGPWLQGYPFERITPLFEAGLVLYDHVGDVRELRVTGLDGPDLPAGRAVSAIDWNGRSRWSVRHHPPSGDLFYSGDERNDERINLYRLPLQGGEPVALTDEPYLYGWSFSPDRSQIALIVRRGDGPFTSCLELMAPDGSDRRPVLCDAPEASFTWGEPSWAPDGRGVVVRVNLAGRRDRGNLAWIPFERPELQILTDTAATRSGAWALARWLDGARFVFAEVSAGLPRVGVYDLGRAELRVLHTLDRDLSDLRLLQPGDAPLLLAVAHRPDGDRLLTLDLEGRLLAEHPVDGTVSVLGDDERSRALIQWTSARSPFATHLVSVGADGGITLQPWQELPRALADRIVQCDTKPVTFPTHDLDPTTGQPRQIHAFLHTPRRPLPEPAVRITAFYGGSNRFDADTQILCEAGVATLSPAVRGSGGYGADFARLNDGDLGGDEIVDLFYAARFLVDAHGYRPDRIGVHGRSHGGYATMRAMTFPATPDAFPFAFGMAEAGFSDILTFWETCNIPDWVVLEAGDPITEADRLRDRSPLHHVDRLAAPLLLVHGENDSRVPVAESRQMAEACAAAGKRCTYVEVPGQGHKVRGLLHERQVWQARLAFLEDALRP